MSASEDGTLKNQSTEHFEMGRNLREYTKLLQAKEARPSVLEPYAGKGEFDHQGQRAVVGQRLMQSANDGMHYYIRELCDMKFSIPAVKSGRVPA
jgi:hypothetical protein